MKLTAWCPLLDFDISLALTVFLPQLAFILICDAVVPTHLRHATSNIWDFYVLQLLGTLQNDCIQSEECMNVWRCKNEMHSCMTVESQTPPGDRWHPFPENLLHCTGMKSVNPHCRVLETLYIHQYGSSSWPCMFKEGDVHNTTFNPFLIGRTFALWT